MKKVLTISAVAAAFAVGGFYAGSVYQSKNVASTEPQPAGALDIATFGDDDKASYAFGLTVGEQLAANIGSQKDVGMNINTDIFYQGIGDGLQEQPKLTKEEIQTVFKKVEENREKARKVEMEKAEQQAKDNLVESEKFLTENAKKPGIVTTKSGLQYKVEKMGEGAKPSKEDTITVHYTGTLLNGEKFDSSVDRGEAFTFSLQQVIPGWIEGIQLMPKGSKFTFFIPPKLAYGEHGAGMIPGNSLLQFEIELIDIKSAQADKDKKADTTAEKKTQEEKASS